LTVANHHLSDRSVYLNSGHRNSIYDRPLHHAYPRGTQRRKHLEPPIEVLIAFSILVLVSAIHTCRPIFPGKETWIAGFFSLIHGLAFAATLDRLGSERWD